MEGSGTDASFEALKRGRIPADGVGDVSVVDEGLDLSKEGGELRPLNTAVLVAKDSKVPQFGLMRLLVVDGARGRRRGIPIFDGGDATSKLLDRILKGGIVSLNFAILRSTAENL